jgi:hypothetical protein
MGRWPDEMVLDTAKDFTLLLHLQKTGIGSSTARLKRNTKDNAIKGIVSLNTTLVFEECALFLLPPKTNDILL